MLGEIEVEAAAPQTGNEVGAKKAGADAGVLAGSNGTSWPYRHDWVARTNGKVFYNKGAELWGCSAVVVPTEAANTVFAAGHCVHSGPGGPGWHTNWVFVPDYYNGDRPLGDWAARPGGLWSLTGWTDNGDWDYDIGAVVIETRGGRTLANVTGTQGIKINGPTSEKVWSFGFPGLPNPPFNGEDLITCDGNASVGFFTNEMELLCTMRQGSSGGGWLADFQWRLGLHRQRVQQFSPK